MVRVGIGYVLAKMLGTSLYWVRVVWHSPPAVGVFRRFLTQFLINLHEILQALFATILAPTKNFVKFELTFQKLDHLTCSSISRLKLIEINGFIEERHNSILLHVKWSNF